MSPESPEPVHLLGSREHGRVAGRGTSAPARATPEFLTHQPGASLGTRDAALGSRRKGRALSNAPIPSHVPWKPKSWELMADRRAPQKGPVEQFRPVPRVPTPCPVPHAPPGANRGCSARVSSMRARHSPSVVHSRAQPSVCPHSVSHASDTSVVGRRVLKAPVSRRRTPPMCPSPQPFLPVSPSM